MHWPGVSTLWRKEFPDLHGQSRWLLCAERQVFIRDMLALRVVHGGVGRRGQAEMTDVASGLSVGEQKPRQIEYWLKLHHIPVKAGAKDGPGRGVHVSLADVQERPHWVARCPFR